MLKKTLKDSLNKLKGKIDTTFNFIKGFKRYLVYFFVIIFLSASLVIAVYLTSREQKVSVKAESPTLSFVTPRTNVNKGEAFPVFVFLDTKGNRVSEARLVIRYDNSKFRALGVEPENFLPVVSIAGRINEDLGFVTISLKANPGSSKTGTGVLAKLSFKARDVVGISRIFFGSQTTVFALGSETNIVGNMEPVNITVGDSTGKIGDINQDGLVNTIDITIAVDNYDLVPPANPRADINQDGLVNIIDICIIIDNYDI